MSENTSLKAVIYARYSSDNQREESIEGQLRECTAFAEKTGQSTGVSEHDQGQREEAL